MLVGWREAGWGVEDLEMWIVGYQGQEADVAGLGVPADTSVFVPPSTEVWLAWYAHQNDVFVVDREGLIAGVVNLGMHPLTDDANKAVLDTLVLGVLAE